MKENSPQTQDLQRLITFATVGDFENIPDILAKYKSEEIDINYVSPADTKKMTILERLASYPEESLEKNKVMLYLIDEYGATGLSQNEIDTLRGKVQEEQKLKISSPNFKKEITHPNSPTGVEQALADSPPPSPVPFTNQRGEEQLTKPNTQQKGIKTFATEAKDRIDNKRSIETLTSKGAIQVDSIETPEDSSPQLPTVNLTGYRDFTPERIIAEDLIAIAARQGDLESTAFMSDKVLKSEATNKDEALKNGLAELVTIFPSVHAEVDYHRDSAYRSLHEIKKEQNSTDSMLADHPKIEQILKKDGFKHSTARLKSDKSREDLTNAREILKNRLSQIIPAAETDYEIKKSKVTETVQNFSQTVDAITTQVDLTKFTMPKLDNYSSALKDIVVNAMLKNKQKYAIPKASLQAQASSKTKKITDFTAAKAIKGTLPELSEFSKEAIANCKNYTKEKEQLLVSASLEARSKIINQVAEEYKNTSEFNTALFQTDFFNIDSENSTYKNAYNKVLNQHLNSEESAELTKFTEEKKQATETAKKEIEADLVPLTIKLMQLNEDKDAMQAYAYASFSAYLLKELGIKTTPDLKKDFLSKVNDRENKEEYEYKAADLQNLDAKTETIKILGELGIKEEILNNASVEKSAAIAKTPMEVAMSQAGPVIGNLKKAFNAPPQTEGAFIPQQNKDRLL